MNTYNPSRSHSLWKRLVKTLSKEFSVLENFNMYGFINGEDENIYKTIKTTSYKGWVKMIDYTIFGLKYPYGDTTKGNIEKFVSMIKETKNYKKYMEEYIVDDNHFKKLSIEAEKLDIKIENNSAKYKKSIFISNKDYSITFRSTTISEDLKKINQF